MFHQLQQAVEPSISLKIVMAEWGEICVSLSEAYRRRRPQMENYPTLG